MASTPWTWLRHPVETVRVSGRNSLRKRLHGCYVRPTRGAAGRGRPPAPHAPAPRPAGLSGLRPAPRSSIAGGAGFAPPGRRPGPARRRSRRTGRIPAPPAFETPRGEIQPRRRLRRGSGRSPGGGAAGPVLGLRPKPRSSNAGGAEFAPARWAAGPGGAGNAPPRGRAAQEGLGMPRPVGARPGRGRDGGPGGGREGLVTGCAVPGRLSRGRRAPAGRRTPCVPPGCLRPLPAAPPPPPWPSPGPAGGPWSAAGP